MKNGLIAVFVLINYAIVGPIEPDDPVRQFVNVYAPPYAGTESLEIPFTFITSERENVVIEIFFQNNAYARQLIYARSLESIVSFSGQVTIASFLLQEERCSLWLNARNSGFGISRYIELYHTSELAMQNYPDEELTTGAIANINYIDEESISHLLAEEIIFQGFIPTIETATYGYLAFDNLGIKLINPGNQTITFLDFTLRIGDNQQQFPLLRRSDDNRYALVNMEPIYVNEGYKLLIEEPLFVDPTTFILSYQSIEGFVPTNRIYYPKDRFQELQTTNLIIEGKVKMHNTFSFSYQAQYYSDQALIGPCSRAMYCVTTSDQEKSIGVFEETIHIYG